MDEARSRPHVRVDLMLTADDLRAIVKRHTEETDRLTTYAAKQGIDPEQVLASPQHSDPYCAQDYRDIDALLEFVRAVANLPPVFVHEQGDSCPMQRCGYPLSHPDHASNKACLWLISQGAKS